MVTQVFCKNFYTSTNLKVNQINSCSKKESEAKNCIGRLSQIQVRLYRFITINSLQKKTLFKFRKMAWKNTKIYFIHSKLENCIFYWSFLLKPEKRFGNVLKILTSTEKPESIFFLSQLNNLSNYSPHKKPCQFRREVKKFLEGEALKRFKYKSYPSGRKVFEKFHLLTLDFPPNLGTTKLVIFMFGWIHYYYYSY